MKKILTLSLATAFGITVMAQEEPKRVCGTLEHEKYLDQQDPTRVAQKAAYAKANSVVWVGNNQRAELLLICSSAMVGPERIIIKTKTSTETSGSAITPKALAP